MTPKISPHEIISPLEVGLDPYKPVCDTDNPQEAAVYAVIINNSQRIGDWTPTNGFPPEYEEGVISRMMSRGSVVEVNEGQGYLIGNTKIEEIAGIMPSK